MIVLGGRTFGRHWGHEGRALLSSISVFMKKTPQGSQGPLLPSEDTAEIGNQKKKGPHPEPDHADTLILGI